MNANASKRSGRKRTQEVKLVPSIFSPVFGASTPKLSFPCLAYTPNSQAQAVFLSIWEIEPVKKNESIKLGEIR